jgi:hypothetical protein
MYAHCDHCGLKYERAPGYFLGSIYFNYGLTTLIVVAAFLTLFITDVLAQQYVFLLLLAFSLFFPIWFFRWARSLWMAFDHFVDPKSGADPATGIVSSADGAQEIRRPN